MPPIAHGARFWKPLQHVRMLCFEGMLRMEDSCYKRSSVSDPECACRGLSWQPRQPERGMLLPT